MNLGTFVHANDSNSTNYFNIINYNKFSSYLDILHHTQVGDQLHQAHFQMMVIGGVCGVVGCIFCLLSLSSADPGDSLVSWIQTITLSMLPHLCYNNPIYVPYEDLVAGSRESNHSLRN